MKTIRTAAAQKRVIHGMGTDIMPLILPQGQFTFIHGPRRRFPEIFPFVLPADPIGNGKYISHMAVFFKIGKAAENYLHNRHQK